MLQEQLTQAVQRVLPGAKVRVRTSVLVEFEGQEFEITSSQPEREVANVVRAIKHDDAARY